MESKDNNNISRRLMMKRRRQQLELDGKQQPSENKNNNNDDDDEKPPPPYGSQDYWEERYKRMKQSKSDNEEEEGEDPDPDPFHAWYFNYEELAPILMPLILGEEEKGNLDEQEEEPDDDVDDHPDDDNEIKQKPEFIIETNNGEGGKSKNSNNNNTQHQQIKNQSAKISSTIIATTTTTPKEEENNDENFFTGKGDNNNDESEEEDDCENDDDDVDYEEINNDDDIENDDDDDDDAPPIRIGLAKNGPISILEVGCGDVPLGRDLAKGIAELGESIAGVQVTQIIKRVVCSDYSKVVIESLKEEQQQAQTNNISSSTIIPQLLCYEIVDARKMPYDNESFDMLIEKGTLDAMLSDKEKGADNCISIVSECARVLTVGGYFVLVSHLNAHSQKGLQWLDDIVVPGLRQGVKDHSPNEYKWNIEVHGNDVEIPSDKEDQGEGVEKEDDGNTNGDKSNHNYDDDDDGDNVEEQSHGPAVYVIQKIRNTKSTEKGTNTDEPPPIDLRFFSY